MLHHRVHNRLEIKGHITLKTAIHIGGSQNEGRGLSGVIKDVFERPFIPGSSFKGCMRSRVESMAHLVVPDHSVCHQVKDGSHDCLSAKKGGIRDMQLQLKTEGQTEAEIDAYIKHALCPSCQLFGGASWRSKVAFDDLHPIDNMIFPTENRDGVGIDRDTRLAANSVKYQFEAVPAGAQFGLKITAENLEPQDLALLSVGMLDLLSGNFAIGGKTSRGLGEIRLDQAQISFWDTSNPDQKLALLLGNASPIKHDPKVWFSNHLKAA